MDYYDEGTGFDLPECKCAYTDPVEKGLGDESFAWMKAQTSDANKSWLRALAREIHFEADGRRQRRLGREAEGRRPAVLLGSPRHRDWPGRVPTGCV